MGKRYYCEFCGRAFLDNLAMRKKHIASNAHQQNRKMWYDSFKSKRQKLEEQMSKPKLCKFYSQHGQCTFGPACRFRHLTDKEASRLQHEIQNEEQRRNARIMDIDPTIQKWVAMKRVDLRQKGKPEENEPESKLKEAGQAVDIVSSCRSGHFSLPSELAALPFLPPSLIPPPRGDWPEYEETEWG